VARQFELSQFRPTSLYKKSKDICTGYFAMTEASFHQRLEVSTKKALTFNPIPFQVSFLCTEGFSSWWSEHFYTNHVDETTFLTNLTSDFLLLQTKTEKSQVRMSKKFKLSNFF
jgi:hypothetical protein